jgi:hypothetical protein
MGEKAPQGRQDDGRLSLLPIFTERKVGPSRLQWADTFSSLDVRPNLPRHRPRRGIFLYTEFEEEVFRGLQLSRCRAAAVTEKSLRPTQRKLPWSSEQTV